MTITGFAKSQDWERFNSSLLIEVTRPNGVFTCTGVAVSSKTVVTAAHCLEGEIVKVRVFTQQIYDPTQPSMEISKFAIHPSYAPKVSQYKNDIAKIEMKTDLPGFLKIYPIFTDTNVTGNIYRFGFGARKNKNIRTVITPKFRLINYNDQVVELDDTFSASGDSGGPIFLQNGTDIKIMGIHSTLSHGPQGRFSYNPLLSAYKSWIFPN